MSRQITTSSTPHWKRKQKVPRDLYIQVAVPSPLRRTFDYKPPGNCDPGLLEPGRRVEVPFGTRKLIGVITGSSSSSDFPENKIRKISKVIDSDTLLDEKLLSLYRWSANYYQHPIGQALQTSLPKQLRKGLPAAESIETTWQLSKSARNLDPESLKSAPRQQQVVKLLSKAGALTSAQIKEALEFAPGSCLSSLMEKGLVVKGEQSSLQVRFDKKKEVDLYGKDRPLTLNTEQQHAFDAISSLANGYSTTLLEGVTGSGKTEIYLQLIAEALKAGSQVLVLVPEISLTPQTIRRFQDRFNRYVVAFHSGLNDTQRLTAWLDARDGTADIIIGTRSAVFTPMDRPGLIIVDEEHDSSYKQQDGFRYSGRDLAIYRGRLLNIPVILGTATPSLESLNNALTGRYHYQALTERAGEASHPAFRILDLKGMTVTDGLSEALVDSIRTHLENSNQVLVFLNRRGFAPILLCRECGWIAACPRCDSSYTLHRTPASLSCHHCESVKPAITACQECGSSELGTMGIGTEKTEQALGQLFPGTPVYRIDRDSTRKKDSLQHILAKVDSGKPCILVGTQMLSKGHHFPGVTLVVILDADGGLFSGNFRGQEHMGQLITQVAGRAGRGKDIGEVTIQTYNSSHPTLRALVNDGYGPFARELLKERKMGNLPPYSFMALAKAESANRALAENFLYAVKEKLAGKVNGLHLIGPLPSPMEKRGGLFRFQLLIEAEKRSVLQLGLHHLMTAMEKHESNRKIRWAVDVDPVDFT